MPRASSSKKTEKNTASDKTLGKKWTQTSRQILHSDHIPALWSLHVEHVFLGLSESALNCRCWHKIPRYENIRSLCYQRHWGVWIRGARQLYGHNGSLTYKGLKGRTISDVGTVTAATSAYAAYVCVVFACIHPPRQLMRHKYNIICCFRAKRTWS